MSNKTTLHKQKTFLSPIDKELYNNGNYLDKILEVTGGKEPDQSVTIKVVYDYEEFNKRE